MLIQLNFTNPLYVSFEDSDEIVVMVKNQSYFERKAYPDFLPLNYTMQKVLFGMMENDTLS